MKMTLISALALGVLGTTLYQVKTGIDQRQDRLQQLEAEISATKRDIAVLEAEWAYLSRPERVSELSSRLLNMQPIGQDRILPLDAIPMRLIPEFKDAEIEDDGIARVNSNPKTDLPNTALPNAPGALSVQKISTEPVMFVTGEELSSIIVPSAKPVRPIKISKTGAQQ